jgi:hypothetical protein
MTEYRLTIFREGGRVRQKIILFAESLWQAIEMAQAAAGHDGDEWDLLPLTEIKAAQDIEAKLSTKH